MVNDKNKKEELEENSHDSELRINWDDMKDIGIITHYKGDPFTGVGFGLDKNGNLEDEVEMKNGLKHGTGKIFYENGQIQEEGNFIDDQKHGKLIKYYEDGKLKDESEWVKGEQRGVQKSYFTNGIVRTFDWDEVYERKKKMKDFQESNIKEDSIKREFLKRVKLFNPDFKDEDGFRIDFGGNGGSFFTDNYVFEITTNDGNVMDGNWDYNNDDEFLYDLIHNSGIEIEYNDYGTDGTIEYIGSKNKLSISTLVIGNVDEKDWELDREEIEDKYGQEYKLEIK